MGNYGDRKIVSLVYYKIFKKTILNQLLQDGFFMLFIFVGYNLLIIKQLIRIFILEKRPVIIGRGPPRTTTGWD